MASTRMRDSKLKKKGKEKEKEKKKRGKEVPEWHLSSLYEGGKEGEGKKGKTSGEESDD